MSLGHQPSVDKENTESIHMCLNALSCVCATVHCHVRVQGVICQVICSWEAMDGHV
jgi:hypothetical protein